MYYIEENSKIVLFDESKGRLVDTIAFMPQYQHLEIYETDKEIVTFDGEFYFEDDPVYIAKKEQDEKERIDNLFLTPSDVERALYKAKGMDFEDLKALIGQSAPQLDMKALAIEFRANNFYRGVMVNGIRLIDTVGQLLNISSEQLDRFFETKDWHYLISGENNELQS